MTQNIPFTRKLHPFLPIKANFKRLLKLVFLAHGLFKGQKKKENRISYLMTFHVRNPKREQLSMGFSQLDLDNFIFRYDTRGEEKNYDEARHWSDDKVLTGRAFFRGDNDPGRLILDNVGGRDQGIYKCRVDFRKAPTRISNVNLNVIGESQEKLFFLSAFFSSAENCFILEDDASQNVH